MAKVRPTGAAPRLPVGAETAYVKALVAMAKRARALVMAKLGPVLARMAKAEQAEQAERTDSVDELRQVVEAMIASGELASLFTSAEMTITIGRIWERVADHNRGEVGRVLGITGPLLDLDLRPDLDRWRGENVRLIRSIGPEMLSDVLTEVTEAQAQGVRVEQLAERIQARFGVAESRAELIARDQVLKANADLTRVRMQRVGVARYRWSTSKDQRVREGHRALEGDVFAWSSPPVVDPSGRRAHPGTDFQCRCVAIPILDDEAP